MGGRGLLIGSAVLILLIIPIPVAQIFARGILLLLLFSWFTTWRVQKKLSIEPEFKTYHLFAFERQSVSLTIKNHSRFPVEVLGVKDESGPLHCPNGNSKTLSMDGRTQTQLRYTVWYEHRGLYSIGPTSITGIDPLGFYPWSNTIATPRTVIVFPRIVPTDLRIAKGLLGNMRKSPWIEHRDTMETKAVRPWQEGDEFRNIHWKQSARSNKLMVRENPFQQDTHAIVLLNLRSGDFDLRRKTSHIERCIEATTAILVTAQELGIQCHFAALAQLVDPLSPDEKQPYRPGTVLSIAATGSSITTALEYLSLMGELPGEHNLLDTLAELPTQSKPFFILVSPALSQDDYDAISHFAGSVKKPRLVILDERVNRPNRLSMDESLQDPRLEIWKLQEHSDDAGEPHVAT